MSIRTKEGGFWTLKAWMGDNPMPAMTARPAELLKKGTTLRMTCTTRHVVKKLSPLG